MSLKPHLPALAALTLVIAIVSANSYRNEFVSDDQRLITRNLWLEQGSWLDAFRRDYYAIPDDDLRLGYYRPLALIANRVDFRLHGRAPAGWHLSNWLAHLGVSLLLYVLALRLTRSLRAAAPAALLFAASPIHAESVTFVSGRVDLLATGFGLASILAALAARPLLSAALWLPALLAKESAIVVPLLSALVLLVAGESDLRTRSNRVAKLALLSLPFFLAYLGLRLAGTGVLAPRGEPSPAPATLARALNVHAFYWSKLLVPTAAFDVEPPLPGGEAFSPARSALALAFPALAVALLAARRERLREFALGLLWVSVALLPVSQLVKLETAVSPRYLYLGSAGFALALGAALARLGRPGLALGLALTAGEAALLVHHNGYFRHPLTFYAARTAIDPDNQAARLNLAASKLERDDVEGALAELREAVRRWPDEATPRYRLGSLALEAGLAGEAAEHLALAAHAMPLLPEVHLSLGLAEMMRNEPARAASAYRRAVLANPASAEAAVGLAVAAAAEAERGGDPCAVLRAYAAARALAPESRALVALAPVVAECEARCAALGAPGAAR